MSHRGRLALLFSTLLVAAACGGTGATSRPTDAASVPPSDGASGAPTDGASTDGAPSAGGDGSDLLATIQEARVIRISTDPNYAPQSVILPDGTYEGFDIDVANEIGERLGVEVQFETPDFDLVQGGGWNGRWDVSVGSVTITEDRKSVLGFTQPYYYTPAQIAATEASGFTTLEELAGATICVGEATTYLDWLEGTLTLGDGSVPVDPPEGAVGTTLPTDANCAEAIAAGRTEFEGFLSSSTTVQQAIDSEVPIVTVGDPVFFEPLAVAVDLSGPSHEALLAELDRIIGEMHEDGTLTGFSEEWYDGLDLTKATE
jgi:polar amino acid transport system substrate-binding protein